MRDITAINQGTTDTKVVLFDAKEQVHSFAGSDITLHGSKPGLWSTALTNAAGFYERNANGQN